MQEVLFMSGKKGMKQYPLKLKLEAMRLYYEVGKTRAEVTALLGIRDPHAVKEWGKKYRREGANAFMKARGRPHKIESEQAELERLRMENALLKKFRTELRNEGLAKRDIGLSIITKKSTK
jgi:transposase-like protein